VATCAQPSVVRVGTGSYDVIKPVPAGSNGECAELYLLSQGDASSLYAAVAAAQSASAPGGSFESLPPTADLATAWGISFGLVVGCYAIARQVGAVLSLLK